MSGRITLYGSITSPFVRRVRFFCNEVGEKYEMVDTATDSGQAEMRTKNPIWKVPCVEVDGLVLWDSHTILEYLTEKHAGNPKLLRRATGAEVWREKNLVTAADGCVESAVNLFYLRKDGVDDTKVAYLVKQNARIASVLAWLKTQLKDNYFTPEKKIGLPELILFCNLDWMRLRNLYPVLEDATLKAFLDHHKTHPSFVATPLPG